MSRAVHRVGSMPVLCGDHGLQRRRTVSGLTGIFTGRVGRISAPRSTPWNDPLGQIVTPLGALATLEQAKPPKADADWLSSVFVGPAFFIGRAHPAVHAQMLVLPFAVHLDIVILVTHGSPPRLVVLANGKETKTIPGAFRAVPLDLDDRIHHHVVREAEVLLGPLEQLPNRLMALRCAEAALPNAVLDEQCRDFVRIMILVSDRAIAGFQLFDSLNVLKPGQALFELSYVHCENPFSGCDQCLGTLIGDDSFHLADLLGRWYGSKDRSAHP